MMPHNRYFMRHTTSASTVVPAEIVTAASPRQGGSAGEGSMLNFGDVAAKKYVPGRRLKRNRPFEPARVLADARPVRFAEMNAETTPGAG